MSLLQTVPVDGTADITVTAPLKHLCPFVDERDIGSVTITWRTNGRTLELHGLRSYLDAYSETRIPHESLTELIRVHLSAIPGIELISVSSIWRTASMSVTVKNSRGEDHLVPG